MTVVATVCSSCGTPTKQAVKGRCPTCAPAYEKNRLSDRLQREPWIRAYRTSRWQRCRAAVLERDGHRCRLRLPGCLGTKRLVGHHRPNSLERLWEMTHGVWENFIELATDSERVVTACHACHAVDDAMRRRAA
jgi:uncharacterized paraquat-inducible protein A